MRDERRWRRAAESVRALHHRIEKCSWGINADRNLLDATRICSSLEAKPVKWRRHRAESETRKWNIIRLSSLSHAGACCHDRKPASERDPAVYPSSALNRVAGWNQRNKDIKSSLSRETVWLLFQVTLLRAMAGAYSGNSIRLFVQACGDREWSCNLRVGSRHHGRACQARPDRALPDQWRATRQQNSPKGARRRLQESGRSFDIYKHRAWQPQRLLDNWRASLRSAQKRHQAWTGTLCASNTLWFDRCFQMYPKNVHHPVINSFLLSRKF